MVQISIDEIKRDLPAVLQRIVAGETIIITQAGKPLAEIKPLAPFHKELRPFGLSSGEFVVPDDFDDPLPESILQEIEN
jgi:prevent-host-death family protein